MKDATISRSGSEVNNRFLSTVPLAYIILKLREDTSMLYIDLAELRRASMKYAHYILSPPL